MISYRDLRSVILFNGRCKSIVANGMLEVEKNMQARFACGLGREDFGSTII